MTTRAEIRQRIRDELNDNASAKLWSDALLNQWIVEGLRELGRRLGLEKTTSLTSVASQEAYGLPTDTLEVIRVEHPASVMRVPSARTKPATSRALALACSLRRPLTPWLLLMLRQA